MLRHGNPEAIYGGRMWPWQPGKSVPAPTSHTSTSQGWALYTKALAVPHGPNPGRRNNLTTLNLLLPCCKRTSLTGCFCLRLLWQEDHVLISICCTSTIHLHARPQGKHSTHCANRTDPCRKAPAFSVRSDGAYTAAYTHKRSWTWLICKVGTRTRLRTHGTFEIHWNTTVKKAPGAFHSLLKYHCAQRSKQVRLPLKAPKGDDTPSSVQFQEERLKRQKMSWQHAWPQDAIAIGINLVRLKSWACLFLISIPRFSVTLFPYQFVGQLRFLLPVPCLPGSQWNSGSFWDTPWDYTFFSLYLDRILPLPNVLVHLLSYNLVAAGGITWEKQESGAGMIWPSNLAPKIQSSYPLVRSNSSVVERLGEK